MSVMEESVPKRVLPSRHCNLPLLNKIFLSQCDDKMRNTEELKNLVIHFKFKHARNKVVYDMRCTKAEYFRRLNFPGSLQTVSSFRCLLSIWIHLSSVPTLNHNGSEYCTDPEKANVPNYYFNEFFNHTVPPISHYHLMMKVCTHAPLTFFALLRKSNICCRSWTLERLIIWSHFCSHVEAYWIIQPFNLH